MRLSLDVNSVNIPGVNRPANSNEVANPPLEQSDPAANKQNSKVKSQEEVVTPEVIEAAAEAANRIALAFGANIKFEIDEETHIEVLKVIDADTGQVIKEMPPKAILAMLDKLWETIGVFIDEKA